VYKRQPFSIPSPLPGCNSDSAQYSNTPLPRVTGSEDDDEDENEAPCEDERKSSIVRVGKFSVWSLARAS